jgi:phospholipase/carboxylesterase
MSSPVDLQGPIVEPASGKPPAQLVILLHGVGADGEDLIGLAPYLADALPDALFIAPDAPFECDMAPMGRQWFSLLDRATAALSAGVQATAPILDAFIDKQLAAAGLDDDHLAVVGFSQGTMLALEVALRRAKPCAGLVGFSGALVEPERLAGQIRARPRTLLVHGDSDEVVNPACLPAAEAGLAAVGVPVLAQMRPGLGHSIDGPGLGMAAGFLRHCFALDD